MAVVAVNSTENFMFGGGRRAGGEDDDDEFLDDDDYAFKKERKAKIQNRKMKAVSYDTAIRKSKVAGSSSEL